MTFHVGPASRSIEPAPTNTARANASILDGEVDLVGDATTIVSRPRIWVRVPVQWNPVDPNVAVGWRATSRCSAEQVVVATGALERGGRDDQFERRGARRVGDVEVTGHRREPRRAPPSPAADAEGDVAATGIDRPTSDRWSLGHRRQDAGGC